MRIRKSIKLAPEMWQRLDGIAAELNAVARRGQTAGQPGWRALIYEIASGNLIVQRKEQNHAEDTNVHDE